MYRPGRVPSDYDDVLKIKTHEDASKYIARAIREASADEVRELEIYYLTRRLYDLKYRGDAVAGASGPTEKRTLSGGDDSRLFPRNLALLDIRVYHLMELAEAVHDFADVRPDCHADKDERQETRDENARLRKYIARSLAAELPTEIPDLQMYADKKTFVEKMAEHEYLTFRDGRAENPLFRRNIEAGIYRHLSEDREDDDPRAKVVVRRFWEAPSCEGTFSSEEVFCVDGQRKLLVLKDVIRVRKSMQAMFSTNNLRMMLDQNLVPRRIEKDKLVDHRIYPGQETMVRLLVWFTGFECLLDELNMLFFKQKYDKRLGRFVDQDLGHFAAHVPKYRSEFTTKLERVSCDSSMYDGSRWFSNIVIDDDTGLPAKMHAPAGTPQGMVGRENEFDHQDSKGWYKYVRAPNILPTPTGDIFHPDSVIRMKLDVPPSTGVYGYVIETTEPATSPIDLDDPRSGRDGIAKLVSKGRFRERVGTTMEQQGPKSLERHNTEAMEKYVRNWSEYDDFVSCAAPLALKRAGDWGQVEHCKRHNIVFVTADKLAALYAAYRDVPCMYLKYRGVQSYNGKAVSSQERPEQKYDQIEFVQYSFVMFGSKRARQALSPASARQVGGDGSTINLALLSIVVLLAFVQAV